MNNVVVLYRSRYGASEKYANWICEDLKCNKIKVKDADIKKLEKYKTIIFIGGIYGGKIKGLSFIKKNFMFLKDKKIIVVAVGITPYSENTLAGIRALNFRESLQDLPLFYCLGVWNISKMSLPHKIICKMIGAVIRAKDGDSSKNMEDGIEISKEEKKDLTSKKQLNPIFEYINNHTKDSTN